MTDIDQAQPRPPRHDEPPDERGPGPATTPAPASGPASTPGMRLRIGPFLAVIVIWTFISFAGTVGQSLPREAVYTTSDGTVIGPCQQYRPEAVATRQAQPVDWCTHTAVIGPELPPGYKTSIGSYSLQGIRIENALEYLLRPDLWLSIGLGAIAITFLFVFARGTGTLRAGLAAAISIVFLGLLLFPAVFTARIPGDMRAELVTAWQWVIIFYFGSEAAVQAWKVSHPNSPEQPGDAPQARDRQ